MLEGTLIGLLASSPLNLGDRALGLLAANRSVTTLTLWHYFYLWQRFSINHLEKDSDL